MNEELREALRGEIMSQFKDLETLAPGSDEQRMVVENVTKLYKLEMEADKADVEREEKNSRWKYEEEKDAIERDLKIEQQSEQIKDRYFRLGTEVAGLILPLVFYASWMKKGFKFEETGTFTSQTFRNLFSRFRPKR